MKTEISSDWKLSFSRDGGWSGSAEKSSIVHKTQIQCYHPKYPTFDDCYNALYAKIKMYEAEKTK